MMDTRLQELWITVQDSSVWGFILGKSPSVGAHDKNPSLHQLLHKSCSLRIRSGCSLWSLKEA